jgi:hypothetical protein
MSLGVSSIVLRVSWIESRNQGCVWFAVWTQQVNTGRILKIVEHSWRRHDTRNEWGWIKLCSLRWPHSVKFSEIFEILNCYCKTEDVTEVQRCWRNEFGTPPLTRVTVTKTCDKFEDDGTAQNVKKSRSGRPRSSTHDGSFATMLQAYTQSPRESVRLCSRETGNNPLTLLKR